MVHTPQRSLLIVDDSRTSRILLRRLIEELRPQWRITEAASGEEALAMVERELADYISLDVNMTGMSGLEVAGRLKLHHPSIRIVICTANIQNYVRQTAEKAGVRFVAKPITPEVAEHMVALFEE
ncbi:response regulator [Caldichromatium japonicum]|uniref:Response regulator n=1 Tax=Caldichromatium japonicum TaxID=2699430 RepID=A0A6G7VGD0_9GAMM|nr:response regulator [Caldichromatium japonicum]QIK39133.1 response regulator [Caldichromatium japonicum]